MVGGLLDGDPGWTTGSTGRADRVLASGGGLRGFLDFKSETDNLRFDKRFPLRG